jgi:sialic acid synthase
MKGTDQAGSLGTDGMNRMVRDIRILEMAFGSEDIFIEKAVEAAKTKLERSIATNKALPKGHVIKLEDLHLLSPGDGFKWAEKDKLIGKTLKQDVPADEIIYPSFID